MSFVNKILDNDTYTISTLKAMVEQEIERVISNKLLSQAECLDLLNKYSDFNQNNLLQIHNKLSNIKLAGDRLSVSSIDFKEVLLNKLNKTEAVSSACSCANTCESCNDIKINKLDDIYAMLFGELEKMAYDLGNSGDQSAAYLIERTMNKIKSDLE